MNRQKIYFPTKMPEKLQYKNLEEGEDPVAPFTSCSFQLTPFFMIKFVSQAMWSIRRICRSSISNPFRQTLIGLERLWVD